ncbi:hypothetical protein AB205_0184400 [Aquarana catesbeiana]|uniref:GTP-binding protein GEM n=1 Tax=Aquarana catesbeiana TaxID=8400 RepID=A0A2G9RUM3_AQUCT|nr:hypothetical protein AB205_0184400 [Aquarana catesbeiana]
MTLNVTMRRSSSTVVQSQQRWSIAADGKNIHVQKNPNVNLNRNHTIHHSVRPEDYYRCSWSSDSSDSVISSESGNTYYRVVLIGEHGVGKSTLASIFAGVPDSLDKNTYERTLMVDGESATLILIDIASFEKASELRIQLRRARQTEDIPIILVGNKSDLVRCREVSISEGRACAVVFDCKFIETSAAVQHNVKELFEGIVRQVRLRRDSKEKNEKRLAFLKRRESIPKKARRFWGKIVAKKNKNMAFKLKSKSCHDLSVL